MFLSDRLAFLSQKSSFEAFFTIGGRILSIFLLIGTTKFFTTYLSENAYGQLALYNITGTLPSMFYFGPLGQGILRLFPVAKENNEIGTFHHQYQRLFAQGAGIVLVLGLIGALICWSLGDINWSVAILLMAGFSITGSFNAFRYSLQNSIRRRTLAMGIETGDRVLQQGLAILFLWFITDNPIIVLFGYLISSLIFLFINQHYYQKSFPETKEFAPQNTHRNYRKDILRYSWPFLVFGAIGWIQSASDRWVLQILCSTELVGQYAVINQIGFQSLTLLFGSISYFILPILFNRAGSLQSRQQFDHANDVNNWCLWFNVILTFGLCLLFWLFGEEVVRLLSAEKYVILSGYLPAMVIAGGLFTFGQNYANRFMLSMQTSLLLYPKAGAAILGIILTFSLVYSYGLKGLVTASLLTQFFYVLLLISYWYCFGKRNIENLDRNLYSF